jgi:predicted GH43/DUF377 family glycosyl hydrolase
MNNWIKKGLIFSPNKEFDWLNSHAALPIPLKTKNEEIRIFFSSRNDENIASVGFLDINIKEPKKIIRLNKKPVLTSGELGSFDDRGVMAHSVINKNGKLYLYYTGWNVGKNIPFHWSIGLATSTDGGNTFQKKSNGPIMDRNHIDPYFVASPTVLFEEDKWKMWYVSGLGWEETEGVKSSPYHIRYAESNDGINWERKDSQSGIDVSHEGWDSEMIEYPSILEDNDTKYMFYNGNDYGKTGFGYAVL